MCTTYLCGPAAAHMSLDDKSHHRLDTPARPTGPAVTDTRALRTSQFDRPRHQCRSLAAKKKKTTHLCSCGLPRRAGRTGRFFRTPLVSFGVVPSASDPDETAPLPPSRGVEEDPRSGTRPFSLSSRREIMAWLFGFLIWVSLRVDFADALC
jgi:hypothetical protein